MSERKFLDSLKAAGKSLGGKVSEFAGEVRQDEALQEVFSQAKEKIKNATSKEEIQRIATQAQEKASDIVPDGASEKLEDLVDRLRGQNRTGKTRREEDSSGQANANDKKDPDIIDGEVIKVEDKR